MDTNITPKNASMFIFSPMAPLPPFVNPSVSPLVISSSVSPLHPSKFYNIKPKHFSIWTNFNLFCRQRGGGKTIGFSKSGFKQRFGSQLLKISQVRVNILFENCPVLLMNLCSFC